MSNLGQIAVLALFTIAFVRKNDGDVPPLRVHGDCMNAPHPTSEMRLPYERMKHAAESNGLYRHAVSNMGAPVSCEWQQRIAIPYLPLRVVFHFRKSLIMIDERSDEESSVEKLEGLRLSRNQGLALARGLDENNCIDWGKQYDGWKSGHWTPRRQKADEELVSFFGASCESGERTVYLVLRRGTVVEVGAHSEA